MTTDQTPARDRLFALIASIPGSGTVDWCGPARALLDEIAASPVPPPADQTALRQRIAEAVRRVPIKYGAGPDAYTIQPVSIEEADVIAAAVEAVLPPDDRAAALREAADVAVRAARGCGDSEAGQYAASVAAGIGKVLRRVAAEEQPTETQGEFELRSTAEIRAAVLEEAALIAAAENSTCPAVYQCQPCLTRERVAAALLRAAAKDRPAVGEQPETQETP